MRWLWWLLVPAAAYLWLTIYHRIAHREEIAAARVPSMLAPYSDWTGYGDPGDVWDEIAAGPAD